MNIDQVDAIALQHGYHIDTAASVNDSFGYPRSRVYRNDFADDDDKRIVYVKVGGTLAGYRIQQVVTSTVDPFGWAAVGIAEWYPERNTSSDMVAMFTTTDKANR